MAARRPLVIIEGRVHELPVGDSLPVDATGTTPDTGTPLRLLGYDAGGNLHEISVGVGLSLVTGLLTAIGGVGGGVIDGGAAGSVYILDGGPAGAIHTQFYDGGDTGTVYNSTTTGGGA